MEVYHNGVWGTVCDNGWDLNDAHVVCRELGFYSAIAATHRAFYGQGIGSILLGELMCVGTEWTIRNCSQGQSFVCDHYEDAGVKCAVSGNIICGSCSNAKQNTLSVKTCKTNQKQQLSNRTCNKKFDIRLKPRVIEHV